MTLKMNKRQRVYIELVRISVQDFRCTPRKKRKTDIEAPSLKVSFYSLVRILADISAIDPNN